VVPVIRLPVAVMLSVNIYLLFLPAVRGMVIVAGTVTMSPHLHPLQLLPHDLHDPPDPQVL